MRGLIIVASLLSTVAAATLLAAAFADEPEALISWSAKPVKCVSG